MAFMLPIGGIVAGFALAESRTGHAVIIAMLSVWSGLAWFALASSML